MTAAIDGLRETGAQGLAHERHASPGVCPIACNEIPRPFESNAELSQLRLAQRRGLARSQDRARTLHADARHAQQQLVRSRVHLDGKLFEMVERPISLRVEQRVEEWIALVDDLAHIELVEPHQPIRLIKPMLTVELHRTRFG